MKNTILTSDFKAKFHKNFRIAFVGSVIYEITKTLHNFFLVKILAPDYYGVIASCLAFTYLLSKFVDFGASPSLLPFFVLLTHCKHNFKLLTLKHYLYPHLPLAIFFTFITVFFLHNSKLQHINAPCTLILIATVVILEFIRSFLRLFMYTAHQTKIIVILEVSTFFGFILSIWIPILIFKITPTLQTILISHIVESSSMVVILFFFFIQFYHQLPCSPRSLPSNIHLKITKIKFFNYILRISRELFSTHFLTPFFAMRLGPAYAGLFYFSTIIAHSLQSVFKVSVGYMGNALFASLKDENSFDKQQAFSLLCHKLSRIIIPVAVFLIININKLLKHSIANDSNSIVFILPFLFFIILIIDFITSIYEQLYITEEKSEKFLIFKLIEFALFLILIKITNNNTPLPIFLLCVIAIKSTCFIMVSFNAFQAWNIIPKLETTTKQTAIYVILSILLSFTL